MEEKQKLRKIPSRNGIILYIMVIFVIVILYCVILRKSLYQVHTLNDSTIGKMNCVFSIEQVEKNEKQIHIRGFAFCPDSPITYNKNKIVLYDSFNDMYFELPTQMETRTDLNETYQSVYSAEVDYTNAGYNACIASSELNLDECLNYYVGIKYDSNGICGIYLLKNTLGEFINENEE